MTEQNMNKCIARRRLAAAIAVLAARAPCGAIPAAAKAELARAELFVEPTPRCYERLAYGARRCHALLAPYAHRPALREALLTLERVRAILEELAERAHGRLLDGPGPDPLGAELLTLLPAFRSSAAWTAELLNTIETPDGVEFSQRLVGGADELILVVPVGAHSRIVRGPIFALREALGVSLVSPAEAARQGSRPLWLNPAFEVR